MNSEYFKALRALTLLCACVFSAGIPSFALASELISAPALPTEPALFAEMRTEIQAITSASFQKSFIQPIRISFGDRENYPDISMAETCRELTERPNSDWLRPIRSWELIGLGSVVEIELHPIFLELLTDAGKMDRKACRKESSLHDPRKDFDWFQFTMAKILHGLHLAYFENNSPYELEPRLKYYAEFFHKAVQMQDRAYFVPARQMRFPITSQEFESEAEFFATNAELFWMTSDFACRRPVMQKYFETLFPDMRSQIPNCIFDDTMMLIGSNDIVRFNAKFVWKAFYVHTIPKKGFFGSALDSDYAISAAFGHSMIRVVLCESTNPEEQGIHCAHDSVPDFLITFNNNQNLSQLYSEDSVEKEDDASALPVPIRGFTGGLIAELRLTNYLAREAIDLLDKDQYVHYPLKMTKDEIQTMLFATLELYDHYFGAWHNLANNCVIHLLRLMRASMKTDPLLGTPSEGRSNLVLTPDTFLRLLERGGQIEAPVREQMTSDPAIHSYPNQQRSEAGTRISADPSRRHNPYLTIMRVL